MTETRNTRTPLELARDRLGQAQSAIAKVLPVANKHGQYDMAGELTEMMVRLSKHSAALAVERNKPLPQPVEEKDAAEVLPVVEPVHVATNVPTASPITATGQSANGAVLAAAVSGDA